MKTHIFFLIFIFCTAFSCASARQSVDAVVITPAGSSLEFTADPANDEDLSGQNYRNESVILYLPFPANMGVIKGETEELSVIILAPSFKSGTELPILPIGLFEFLERGERVQKVIAIPADPTLQVIKSPTLEQLTYNYPGVTEILKIWFTNHSGDGLIEFLSLEDEKAALRRVREIQQ